MAFWGTFLHFKAIRTVISYIHFTIIATAETQDKINLFSLKIFSNFWLAAKKNSNRLSCDLLEILHRLQ